MVFNKKFASDYSVVSSLEDQYSGGKNKKEYCKKGDSLFVLSNNGNVLIVFGKNGGFPIRTEETKEIMINTPEELISKIKEVDMKMSYGFPIEFVLGIISNKPWKTEFMEKLENSNVRLTLKNEIKQKYENA